MRPAAELADFLEQPVGRSFAGSCWLYFYPRADVCGFALWGRPDVDAIRRLISVLRVELGAAPHVSLVDVRGLESVDPAVFDTLGAYVAAHSVELSLAVRRLALVLPKGGLMRAVTSGFFSVADAPYPVEIFDEPEAALRSLGVADARELAESVACAIEAAHGTPPLVRDLRVWLEGHLGSASVEDAARALGVSTRSLQRRLREESTSFQHESKDAQVRVAQRLLRDPEMAITRVALEVGLSPAHFSALFRRATGVSPSEWRERFGGAAP